MWLRDKIGTTADHEEKHVPADVLVAENVKIIPE